MIALGESKESAKMPMSEWYCVIVLRVEFLKETISLSSFLNTSSHEIHSPHENVYYP